MKNIVQIYNTSRMVKPSPGICLSQCFADGNPQTHFDKNKKTKQKTK